jgi:sulfite reductase alpha subunit-like flavoprotein
VIHPEVPQDLVDDFLSTVGWRKVADKPFRVTRVLTDQTFPEHLPPVVTLRLLFTRYLDFTCVPRKTFFQFILYFTSDEREREKLEDFLTEEGADDLYQYCFYVRRSIKEILDDFHSVKIPIEYVFDVFPPLRPREFSIASSVKKHPHKIQLCVAIINYKTRLKAPRKGICTSYMADLNIGDSLFIGTRRGFIPKLDMTKPIIGIGPGTGLAPVRAIVEERLLEQPSTSKSSLRLLWSP